MDSCIKGIAIGLLIVGATGCTMCDTCDLETFNAYGGRWQRTNPTHGRVGSIFAPAGAQVPYADDHTVLWEDAEPEEEVNPADSQAAPAGPKAPAGEPVPQPDDAPALEETQIEGV